MIFLSACGSGGGSGSSETIPQPPLGQTTGTISGIAATDGTASLAPKSYSSENQKDDKSIIEKLFSSKKMVGANVLDNAQVYAIDYDGISYGPVTTDLSGTFSITGLPITKNNFIIKIKKGNIVLKHIASGVVAGQNINIGSVNSATTALVYLLEKRIKEETGYNVNFGDTTVSIPTIVKTKIQNINITTEKLNFKNSIDADSSSQNPIYLVYATIIRLTEKIKNNEIIQTYEDYIKNTNNSPIPIFLSDSNVYSVSPIDIDTGIKNVRIISNLSISPQIVNVTQNDTIKFLLIATLTNGETQNVSDSANYYCSVGNRGIIDKRGVFYAVGDTGIVNITSKIWGKSISSTITVLDQNEILSISISPANNITVVGANTRQFTAIGIKRNGVSIDLTSSVTWSKTGSTGSLSTNGLYTGIRNGGSAIISARFKGLNSNSVTVNNIAAVLVSISVTPAVAIIQVGGTQQFTATGIYSDSTTGTFSGLLWMSQSNAQGAKGTINSSGLFTATEAGNSLVTILASNQQGIISAASTVNVIDRPLVSITISTNKTTMTIGETSQLIATGYYDDSTSKDLTAQVIWNSSDSTIATINSYGRITGLDSGLTSITAKFSNITSNILNMRTIGVIPVTPNLINNKNIDFDGYYYIQWNKNDYTNTYVLQESNNANFNQSLDLYSGTQDSFLVTAKNVGTYYYRIKSLNKFGESSWSPYISIEVKSIIKISGGEEHTILLTNDGSVWGWGDNSSGQIGDNTTVDKDIPTQVSNLNNITSIACGRYHTIAIKNDGTVWGWGSNGAKQIQDTTAFQFLKPVLIKHSQSYLHPETNYLQIAAGSHFTLALQKDGYLHTLGDNSSNQLGSNMSNYRFALIAAGYSHSLGIATMPPLDLVNGNSVMGWGYNGFNALGLGTVFSSYATPTYLPNSSNTIQIAGSNYITYLLKTNGNVWYSPSSGYITSTGISNIKEILATGGTSNWIALDNNNTAYQYDFNNALIKSIYNVNKIGMTNGIQVTYYFIKNDGSIWGYGDNHYGQLLDGTKINKTSLTKINL